MRITAVFFGRPGGGSFNAAGIAGLDRVASRRGLAPEIVWESDPARRTGTVEAAARRADLVIVHGGQGEAAVAAVAPAFPGVAFAVTQGRIEGPNIAGFEVLQEHSAFLAGALVGWWMPGVIAAHLSGEKVAPGLRGRAGFAHGLTHAQPGARLLTSFCGDQHDPDLAARWTRWQAAAGARIQFTMLDGGRAGAIAAARAEGMRAIGNVRDWTRDDPVFVASAIADNGIAVEAAVDAFCGAHFAGRRIGLDMPAAVRLAISDEIPAALQDRIDGLAQAIIDGAVVVPEHWQGAEWVP